MSQPGLSVCRGKDQVPRRGANLDDTSQAHSTRARSPTELHHPGVPSFGSRFFAAGNKGIDALAVRQCEGLPRPATLRESAMLRQGMILRLVRRAPSAQERGNIFRRKNKIYTSAYYCALRHAWLHGGVELLRNGDAADFLYTAQSCCTITIETRDNDSDKLAVPVLRQRTQENCKLRRAIPSALISALDGTPRQEHVNHALTG
jgi:hypothetical protein